MVVAEARPWAKRLGVAGRWWRTTARSWPIGATMPPTLTIVALAHRLGDHLLARGRQDLAAPALAA